MRRLNIDNLKEDKGAVATLFVTVISSGFIFLFFALTSDASALYFERRSIQNSADATSLAVASYCALGSSDCATSSSSLLKAKEFANTNSPDGVSAVNLLCGYAPLTGCASNAVVECKSVPSNVPRYGRVVLTTEKKDGTKKIESPFFSLLLGNTTQANEIRSCSQSAWGKAGSAWIPLPIAIDICDYLTDGFKIIRDYSAQLSQCPTIIKDVQGFDFSPQPTNVINGWAIFAPGGQDLYCLIPQRLVVGDLVDTLPPGQERCNDPSVSGSMSKTLLADLIAANIGKKVFIPVIASTSGTGTGQAQRVSSTVVGFFSFIFYGYDFGSQIKAGCGKTACAEFTGLSVTDCGSKRDCIWGKFTKGIVPGANVSRDLTFPPVGAQAVELLP